MAKPIHPTLSGVSFTDHPALRGREAGYLVVTVSLAPVLASWRDTLFAHEWLHADGSVRRPEEQSEKVRQKRSAVEQQIATGAPLERPILGIGILDTIEIGAGRETLLTLAALGATQIPVHIPKSHIDEFRPFIET